MMQMIALTTDDFEVVDLTLADLRHIAAESNPTCDDHQLRRVSIQPRQLLFEGLLLQTWRLLQMPPRQPTVVAPHLDIAHLRGRFALAGGGTFAGVMQGMMQLYEGTVPSIEEMREHQRRVRANFTHAGPLSMLIGPTPRIATSSILIRSNGRSPTGSRLWARFIQY